MPRTETALLATAVATGVVAVALASGALPAVATEDPTLESFDADRPTCTDGQTLDGSTRVTARDGATGVVHAANVSLPHPDHVLNASVGRTGPDSYALNVTSEAGDGMAAQCLATARYTAEFTVPQESGYTVAVYHDGERVSTITGDGSGSNAGATDG
jgi:hypothetical protein